MGEAIHEREVRPSQEKFGHVRTTEENIGQGNLIQKMLGLMRTRQDGSELTSQIKKSPYMAGWVKTSKVRKD